MGPHSIRGDRDISPGVMGWDKDTAPGMMPWRPKAISVPGGAQLAPQSSSNPYLQPGDGRGGIPMSCTGDHQLPAHLLEIFLLGPHREGGRVLQGRGAAWGAWQGVQSQGGDPGGLLTFSRTRVGRDSPAVP